MGRLGVYKMAISANVTAYQLAGCRARILTGRTADLTTVEVEGAEMFRDHVYRAPEVGKADSPTLSAERFPHQEAIGNKISQPHVHDSATFDTIGDIYFILLLSRLSIKHVNSK